MALVRENSSVPSQLRTYGDVTTRKAYMATRKNGGTTIDLATFKVPAKTDGYFVGAATGWNGQDIPAHIIPESEFTLERFRRTFGHLYADHLTREQIENSVPIVGGYIGTWTHEGFVYVDAINWTADYSEAVTWAVARGEHSIWDVSADAALEVATLAPLLAVSA